MEFLSEYLQVLVTLAVILGAAVIAGICDALKTNNENLRAELLEMQLRLDQVGMAKAVSGASQSAHTPITEDKGTPANEDPLRRPRASRMRRGAVAGRGTRRAPSADAIAVMQQGLQMAGADTVASTMTAASKPEISAAPREAIEPAQRTDETHRNAETLADSESRAVAAASSASKPEAAAGKQTSSLLGRTLVPEDISEDDISQDNVPQDEAPERIPEKVSTDPTSIPSGFQDGHVLTRMVQAHQPVSGLVISVGVNPGPVERGIAPPARNIREMIRSLLGNEDFAAPSAENEYLLIFPNQRGAAAQHKLSEVTQQLWDYQIRSAGTYSILFSWGGLEVEAEAIDEAIASASERMRQTRHNRLAIPAQSAGAPSALRHAV